MLTYLHPSRQYILDTDASNEAADAMLSQMVEGEESVVAYYSKTFSPPQQNYCWWRVKGEERIVAYYSKTFSSPQRNYCVTKRELLAVVMVANHFRSYLYGQEFRLRTDHTSLTWLYKCMEFSHQVAGVTGGVPIPTGAQGRHQAWKC